MTTSTKAAEPILTAPAEPVGMICFTANTMADALRKAADHVENREVGIFDIIATFNGDSEPMVTIYQGNK